MSTTSALSIRGPFPGMWSGSLCPRCGHPTAVPDEPCGACRVQEHPDLVELDDACREFADLERLPAASSRGRLLVRVLAAAGIALAACAILGAHVGKRP